MNGRLANNPVPDLIVNVLTHWSSGNYQTALDDFAALATQPDSQDSVVSVATYILADTQQNDDAIRNYYCGLLLQNMGKPDLASHYYNRAIELDPDCGGAFRNLGWLSLAQRDPSKAIEMFSQAIRLAPEDWQCYDGRARAYELLGQVDEAVRDYTRAIDLDPDQAALYGRRGRALEAESLYAAALADYVRQTSLDTTNEGAWIDRAAMHRMLGRYEEAARDCTEAIRLNPRSVLGYNNRGNSYHDLSRYEEALADRSRALELDPTYLLAYFNRGNTHREMGHVEEALSDYTKVIELSPNDVNALRMRSFMYLELHRDTEAFADLRQLTELDSRNGYGFRELGKILYDQGDLEQSLTYLESAARLRDHYGEELARLVRKRLDRPNDEEPNEALLTFLAFRDAGSPQMLAREANRDPFMITPEFSSWVDRLLERELPSDYKDTPILRRHLVWLEDIREARSAGR